MDFRQWAGPGLADTPPVPRDDQLTLQQSEPAQTRYEAQWPYISNHRELDESKEEIRILTILKGPPDSDICCTLQHESLSEAGEFAALSYCWGEAGETAPIDIDAERVYVRKNLWSFLWHLRELKGTIKVWIDFLCINQRNINEKNHQVKLMKNIFSTAVMVYAWLGDSTPAMIEAVELIKRGLTRRKGGAQRRRRRAAELRLLQVLFDQEYWTRLWIIQEIVLAREVQIIVGSRIISWRELVGVYQRPGLTTTCRGKKTFNEIMNLNGFDGHSKESTISIEALFLKFFHAQCQDPRDRIYGMLGMTSSSDREQVVVDYQASTLLVCIENIMLLIPKDSPSLEDAFQRVRSVFSDDALLRKEIRQFSNNQVLRSNLPSRMNLEIYGSLEPHLCYTFAAKRQSEDQFCPLTENTKSELFDLYLSWLTPTRERSHTFDSVLLYTTCLPTEDDVFVNLGIFSRTILIGRKHGQRIRCVELGVQGTSPSMRSNQEIYQIMNPNHWMVVSVPKAEIEIEVEMNYGSRKYLRMNGVAFFEMMRRQYQPDLLSIWPTVDSSMIVQWNPQTLLETHLQGQEEFSVPECEGSPLGKRLDGSAKTPKTYHLGHLIQNLPCVKFNDTVPRVSLRPPAEWTRALPEG